MATILCPRAVPSRSLASSPSTNFTLPLAKAAFTTSTSPLSKRVQPSRPSITCRLPPHLITTRHASSLDSATTTTTSPPANDILTWDRFFALRRRKRYINLAASLATASATVAIVGPILAQQDIDTWGAQISGIDPIFVLGISTMAVAGGGWLCGPTFGGAAFGVWAGRRGWARAIQEKEKSFYRRIQMFRADPSSSSPQNPIPDYYGEKVASVRDYRRWLKDQRAFKLKKNKDLF
ncbi:TIM23 complex component [Friedmanniomyces endolithicus]|nr:TIM23 complex component [Friedmanniomyces endolithicus]